MTKFNLESALKNKTVLLLGAGASADYGFPLWDDLRKIYIEFVDLDFEHAVFSNHSGATYWRDQLLNNNTDSVDAIAAKAQDEGVELFQLMTIAAFLKLEQQDLDQARTGWIEKFADSYLKLVAKAPLEPEHIKPLFENLSIVSLNYERCFGVRLFKQTTLFFNNYYPNSIIRNGALRGIDLNFKTIIQPHGSLGIILKHSRKTGAGIGVTTNCKHSLSATNFYCEYGESIDDLIPHYREFNDGPINSQHLKSIMPVDLMRFEHQTSESYRAANKSLLNAKNVIIIGMSKDGFNQSFLDISPHSTVYCTGGEKLTPDCIQIGHRASDINW